MSEIPSTQVIRHWVAWGTTGDCPDEHSEHSAERVKLFEQWLETQREAERERIIKLLEDYQQKALASHIVFLGLERAIKIIKGQLK